MLALAVDTHHPSHGGILAWYWYLLVLVVAAAGTAATVPLALRLAKRFNAIDYPDGRRVNKRPVPRLGGIALLAGLLLAILVLIILDISLREALIADSLNPSVCYPGVLLAVLAMFAVGVIDDLKGLRARYKLIGQTIAAAIAVVAGVLFDHFANPFSGELIQLGWMAYPITIFYLVAFANIINLIDGLDGLAAGIVAISATALFFVAVTRGGPDAAVVAVALVGACLAFLFFNFYPARVFMGDSGALLLGFSLGIVSLFGVVRTPALITLLVPVVIAGLPVIDTFAAIIRRRRNHKGVLEADTQHMHHRFLDIGLDQRTTVLVMYSLSALLAICAFIVLQYSGPVRIVIVLILAVVVIFLVMRLRLFGPVLSHHYNKRIDDGKPSNIPDPTPARILPDLPPDADIDSSQL